MKKFDEQNEQAAPSSVQSAGRYRTLFGRINSWFDQRTRMDSIAQAQAQAQTDAKSLGAQHEDLEKQLSQGTETAGNAQGRSRVTELDRLHALAQIHSILDDRAATQQQLAVVYGRWHDQVQRQHQI